jgi:hypothetical protein
MYNDNGDNNSSNAIIKNIIDNDIITNESNNANNKENKGRREQGIGEQGNIAASNIACPPYKLDPMSDEQYLIFSHIKNGDNAIGDACAGSGKSTTILSIAENLPTKSFLQLAYNSMLRKEIQEKTDKLSLTNICVHTFHSLVVKYYSDQGHTDTEIRRVLLNNTPPRTQLPKYDVIVIDEAQDMTFLYFKLIIRFCRDMGGSIQLLVLGDFMQGLYEFKGADTRFLTCADKIWSDFPYLKTPTFHHCTLKMSYRITRQMADFVNNVLLGEERLFACKDGEPVYYIRRGQKDVERFVVHKIKSLLNAGAHPRDFFILGGSVKGDKSPIRKIENALVEQNIPCHVPMFENDKIDERVIDGKVVFSTFHSVKGRQRKYVFVIGFDQSYFKYFARNCDDTVCPNTLYVACTRATHQLYVVERHNPRYPENAHIRPLRFLKMSHMQMKSSRYISFQGLPQGNFSYEEDEIMTADKHFVTPTDLIKFIPENVLEDILPILEKIFEDIGEQEPATIDIPTIISTKCSGFEDVSDLNGIAIPMMYFDVIGTNGSKPIYDMIENKMQQCSTDEHSFLKKAIELLPATCNNPSDYLYLANVYVAVCEKLYFKLNQISIDEYGWLDNDMLEDCIQRLHDNIIHEISHKDDSAIEVEKLFIQCDNNKLHANIDRLLREHFSNEEFRFSARLDLVTDYSVWEIKCTSDITNDHLLQLVIYAWLWRYCIEDMENLENIRDFKLINIKNGKKYRLNATTPQLDYIVISLLKGKYFNSPLKNETDFITECKNYIHLA